MRTYCGWHIEGTKAFKGDDVLEATCVSALFNLIDEWEMK